MSTQMDSAETVKVVSIMKAIRNEEEAVSPVIGVILMVAIVVILAAVIAAFVFGMAGGVQSTKTVGATAKYVSANQVEITYQGGTDNSELQMLTIKVCNVTATTPTCLADQYTKANNVTTTKPTTMVGPSVGSKFVVPGYVLNSNAVSVVGTFSDGSEQVILDTRV